MIKWYNFVVPCINVSLSITVGSNHRYCEYRFSMKGCYGCNLNWWASLPQKSNGLHHFRCWPNKKLKRLHHSSYLPQIKLKRFHRSRFLFLLPVPSKNVTVPSLPFLGPQKIVTVTSFPMFKKSHCFRFFITSRLLKVVVCKDHYKRWNGNSNDVMIKRICAHHGYIDRKWRGLRCLLLDYIL
jgi:hypothetical protein